MNNWMLIDCSYLAYRSAYAEGPTNLSFIATLNAVRERFDSSDFAFFFDGHHLKRRDLFPEYKQRERDEKAQDIQRLVQRNLHYYRTEMLPSHGFENIFYQDGYEADDLIASACENLAEDDEAVIVSADHDLYQLLGKRVVFWKLNRKEIYNAKSFREEYHGCPPNSWPMIKAIAGCSSDNIPGISGVGEKTAAKYLSGTMNTKTKTYQKIAGEGVATINSRLKLVELPMEGTMPCFLEPDVRPLWKSFRVFVPDEEMDPFFDL